MGWLLLGDESWIERVVRTLDTYLLKHTHTRPPPTQSKPTGAKKILEWTDSPANALAYGLYFNDRCAFCWDLGGLVCVCICFVSVPYYLRVGFRLFGVGCVDVCTCSCACCAD